MGISPLKWAEINAYCQLRGITLEQWELDLIIAFDSLWLKVMTDDTKEISAF